MERMDKRDLKSVLGMVNLDEYRLELKLDLEAPSASLSKSQKLMPTQIGFVKQMELLKVYFLKPLRNYFARIQLECNSSVYNLVEQILQTSLEIIENFNNVFLLGKEKNKKYQINKTIEMLNQLLPSSIATLTKYLNNYQTLIEATDFWLTTDKTFQNQINFGLNYFEEETVERLLTLFQSISSIEFESDLKRSSILPNFSILEEARKEIEKQNKEKNENKNEEDNSNLTFSSSSAASLDFKDFLNGPKDYFQTSKILHRLFELPFIKVKYFDQLLYKLVNSFAPSSSEFAQFAAMRNQFSKILLKIEVINENTNMLSQTLSIIPCLSARLPSVAYRKVEYEGEIEIDINGEVKKRYFIILNDCFVEAKKDKKTDKLKLISISPVNRFITVDQLPSLSINGQTYYPMHVKNEYLLVLFAFLCPSEAVRNKLTKSIQSAEQYISFRSLTRSHICNCNALVIRESIQYAKLSNAINDLVDKGVTRGVKVVTPRIGGKHTKDAKQTFNEIINKSSLELKTSFSTSIDENYKNYLAKLALGEKGLIEESNELRAKKSASDLSKSKKKKLFNWKESESVSSAPISSSPPKRTKKEKNEKEKIEKSENIIKIEETIEEDDEDIYSSDAFMTLLLNPAGRSSFTAFSERIFCEENIKFWTASEEFRLLSKDADDLRDRAKDIYNKFFTANSIYQINIDETDLKTVSEYFTENSTLQVHTDMFSKVQKSLFLLMLSDTYSKYLRSNDYKEYLQLKNSKKDIKIKKEKSIIKRMASKLTTSDTKDQLTKQKTNLNLNLNTTN